MPYCTEAESSQLDKPRDPNVIPEHTRAALDFYARTGSPVGGFLAAVLSNDLEEACHRADSQNGPALLAIVTYIYNHLPARCHGSPDRYARWSRHHTETDCQHCLGPSS